MRPKRFRQLRVRRIPFRVGVFSAVYEPVRDNHEYIELYRLRSSVARILYYKRRVYAAVYLVPARVYRDLRATRRIFLRLRPYDRLKYRVHLQKMPAKTEGH